MDVASSDVSAGSANSETVKSAVAGVEFRRKRLCAYSPPKCPNPSLLNGFCMDHGGDQTAHLPNECCYPNCGKPTVARGICAGHYRQFSRHQMLQPLRKMGGRVKLPLVIHIDMADHKALKTRVKTKKARSMYEACRQALEAGIKVLDTPLGEGAMNFAKEATERAAYLDECLTKLKDATDKEAAIHLEEVTTLKDMLKQQLVNNSKGCTEHAALTEEAINLGKDLAEQRDVLQERVKHLEKACDIFEANSAEAAEVFEVLMKAGLVPAEKPGPKLAKIVSEVLESREMERATSIELAKALLVVMLNPGSRAYLDASDPKAVEQAKAAIGAWRGTSSASSIDSSVINAALSSADTTH